MSEASSPPTDRTDALRHRTFGSALRGYDRDEVERFQTEVADLVESLHVELTRLQNEAGAATRSEEEAIGAELAAVRVEVGRILDAAREAADNMRSRAAEDASRWRAEASSEVAAMRSVAEHDAVALRTAAWDASVEMLEQVRAAVDQMHADAQKDVLFIRSEAEREGLRITADGRREAEEITRTARADAERVLGQARSESQRVLDAARQSAEAAQERARALEVRRAELLDELESTRASLMELEDRYESRREAATETSPEAPERVPPKWQEESSVRVVRLAESGSAEPVDAEAMAAEVRALRERTVEPVPTPEPAARPVPVDEPSPVVPGPEPNAQAEPAAESEPQGAPAPEVKSATEPEPETEVEPAPGPESEVEPAPEPEAGVESESEVEPEPEPEPEVAAPPVIDDLFARLRTPVESPPPPVASGAGVLPPTGREMREETAEEGSVEGAAPSAGGDMAEEPAAEAVRESPVQEGTAPPPPSASDPLAVRDRLLLPIENRALRAVKRELVELQNGVLEELRVAGDEWTVDRAMFAARLEDPLVTLGRESAMAGVAAAGEMTGSVPPAADVAPPDGGDVVDGLVGAVAEAIARANEADGGSRQVAASASRVFRAWRTDQAERRVNDVAATGYHRGLAGTLAALGVTRARLVTGPKACPDCRAAGVVATDSAGAFPPLHPGCSCTLAPGD